MNTEDMYRDRLAALTHDQIRQETNLIMWLSVYAPDQVERRRHVLFLKLILGDLKRRGLDEVYGNEWDKLAADLFGIMGEPVPRELSDRLRGAQAVA